MSPPSDDLRAKLSQLATEDTFLNAYARRRARSATGSEWIGFCVAGETYALPIGDLREILKVPPITEVPRVPRFVLGVAPVRGMVVPILCMRRRLGFPPAPIGRSSRVLVCEVDGERYGLLVDAVSAVERLQEGQIERSPQLGGGAAAEFVAGIGRAGARLIILLDARAVVTFSSREAR